MKFPKGSSEAAFHRGSEAAISQGRQGRDMTLSAMKVKIIGNESKTIGNENKNYR